MKTNGKFVAKTKEFLSKYYISSLIIPLLIIVAFAVLIMCLPDAMLAGLDKVRGFLTGTTGIWYLVVGLGFVVIALVMAFSRIGKIKLGKEGDKPMSTLKWGTLIFTSTMAADVLFYALHEWSYYYSMQPLDTIGSTAAESVRWASSYPLFHWGIIPWLFYIVLAVCYGYMFYVRRVNGQRLSEACRPLLGNKFTDGIGGRTIDIVSVLGLLLGTSTTFSVATPLITAAICKLFNIAHTNIITIIVLLVIASISTLAVITGFKGISKISTIGICGMGTLLAYVFIVGNPRFILESGLQGAGDMLNNFLRMSTWTDPTRATSIPQDWTIFYWSYWIAWAIATPLFIAKISKGRTVKNVIIGGTLAGVLSTFCTFMIMGGAGLKVQTSGAYDAAAAIAEGVPAPEVIINIITHLPGWQFILVLLIIAMILLYATTFDAINHTMASFITKKIGLEEEPSKVAKVAWSLLFVVLPIALIYSDAANSGLTAMSIIAALPLSIIFILIIISFFKSVRQDLPKKVKDEIIVEIKQDENIESPPKLNEDVSSIPEDNLENEEDLKQYKI